MINDIKTQIANSTGLDLFTKAVAINAINNMGKANAKRKAKLGFQRDAEVLAEAFQFATTPQGSTFWHSVAASL